MKNSEEKKCSHKSCELIEKYIKKLQSYINILHYF